MHANRQRSPNDNKRLEPFNFILRGRKWSVEANQHEEPTEFVGLADFRKQKITVYTKDSTPEYISLILWHEISHAILETLSPASVPHLDEETLVETFAQSMMEILPQLSSFPKWALPIKLMEKTPKSKRAAKAKTE
jgi:hypothetical protein